MTPITEKENQCPKCKATLTGRHCLACGFSHLRQEDMNNGQACLRDTKRLPTAEKEGKIQKLVEVMRSYNLALPRNAHEWRTPPEPEAGYIRGITTTSVRLLCTDGILGWFAWDNGEVILGHMQRWEPLCEPKERQASERPKAVRLSQKARQLLEED